MKIGSRIVIVETNDKMLDSLIKCQIIKVLLLDDTDVFYVLGFRVFNTHTKLAANLGSIIKGGFICALVVTLKFFSKWLSSSYNH